MSANGVSATLQPHPVCASIAASASVSVQIASAKDRLQLTYTACSRIAIKLPQPRGPEATRRNELWLQTCGEMFIHDPNALGPYLEFNFSPTGDWAAYAFEATRRGMRSHRWSHSEANASPTLRSTIDQLGDPQSRHRLIMEVSIPRSALGSASRLYPTMVLETIAGMSWWAIWHPTDRPQFHHPDNFLQTLEVP